MDSRIQPILCCVGEAVAGRPTQFLMERAFDAAQCDWRVITVEVKQENFQKAFDGMRAMKFTAVRFFPEFQSVAASLMLDQPAASLGAVTSAMRQGDTWTGWDNQGFGLLDLIAGAAPASSTLLWLHGQSRLTHSLFKATQVAEYSPSRLLWSDTPEGLAANADAQPRESAGQLPSIVSLVELEATLKEILSQPNPFKHLAVVGEELKNQLPLLSQLEVVGEVKLLLATNQLLTRQQVNDAWAFGKATVFSDNDQLLAAEAYDFRRWTGQPADVELFRDAYDEYADF